MHLILKAQSINPFYRFTVQLNLAVSLKDILTHAGLKIQRIRGPMSQAAVPNKTTREISPFYNTLNLSFIPHDARY